VIDWVAVPGVVGLSTGLTVAVAVGVSEVDGVTLIGGVAVCEGFPATRVSVAEDKTVGVREEVRLGSGLGVIGSAGVPVGLREGGSAVVGT
jgi:hypothetical protein